MSDSSTSAAVKKLAVVCLVVLAMPLPGRPATVVNLGDFGGSKSIASFINNEGDVAGYSYLTGTTYHAFFYSGLTTSSYTAGTVYDIGTFGGSFSQPHGLNASGGVSGTAYASGNAPNAFAYVNGVLTDLGTLGGTTSFGYGVNDSGTVVGSGYLTGNSTSHAMNESTPYSGTPQDVGTLGGSSGDADFINANGQIAGNANTAGDHSTLAFYSLDGTTLVSITLGGTSSTAYGINSSGQVIGKSTLSTGTNLQGFLYTPGTTPVLTDLGTLIALNAGASDAEAINSSGDVVGESDVDTNGNGVPSGFHHAYLYHQVGSNWVMTDLGTLNSGAGNSVADAINSLGEVVGTASAPTGTDPFIYMNGQMLDLNSFLPVNSGFTQLLTATGINDNGQIIGQGITTGGAHDAYVLDINGFASAPEPWTLSTGVIGLILSALGIIRKSTKV